MTKINIREAAKEDMIDVFQMVRELATYEKLEDRVQINHTTLEEDGFGSSSSSPAFRCLLAERIDSSLNSSEERKTIGYALFINNYSTWLGKSIFLEDLYVKKEFRNCGAGKKLFLAVAEIAQELSCRMDFHVLAWNKPSIEFYKRLGAVCLTETEDWHLYRLSDDSLKKSVQEL